MLIGSVLKLHFADYLRQALPPVLASPLLLWLWLWLAFGPGATAAAVDATPASEADDPPFDA